MMRRRRQDGECRLCGFTGKLSFEHVPPRKAYNDTAVKVLDGLPALDFVAAAGPPRGRTSQRGAGDHTLCEPCNSNTGAWYGSDFIIWAKQARDVLVASNGSPSIAYPYHLFPLRVLKQVVAMFFSQNPPTLRRSHPALAAFVLEPGTHPLPTPFRAFAFLTLSDYSRHSAFSLMVADGVPFFFSEITAPPFGFVLTMGSPPPHRGMVEITQFGRHGYDDYEMCFLQLPLLPIECAVPGVYASAAEVARLKIEHEPHQVAGQPTGLRVVRFREDPPADS